MRERQATITSGIRSSLQEQRTEILRMRERQATITSGYKEFSAGAENGDTRRMMRERQATITSGYKEFSAGAENGDIPKEQDFQS